MSSKIPKPVLAPLAATRWKSDEYSCGKFAETLAWHAEQDDRCGCTSAYHHSGRADDGDCGLTYTEARALAPHIPPSMVHVREGSVSINQHYEHSLEQFYAEVYRAWDAHVQRTRALVGTPSGTIALQPDASHKTGA